MAFSRKFLKALGLEDNVIDTIMEEHVSVTTALTTDRDRYKTEADKLPGLQKQLEDQKKAAQNDEGKDYKQLYDDLVAENATKEARAAKVAGYKGLLKSANIAEKYWPLIIQANTAIIDKLEMDGDKVKGAEEKVTEMKTSLKDYVSTTKVKGTEVDNPPDHENQDEDDLGEMDMEDYIAARKKM